MKNALPWLCCWLGFIVNSFFGVSCSAESLLCPHSTALDSLPCTHDLIDLDTLNFCNGECFELAADLYCDGGEYLITAPDGDGCIDTTRFVLHIDSLDTGAPDISCNTSNTKYTVSFSISGTAPFYVNGVIVANNGQFQSGPINSGSNYFFVVTDSSICRDTINIQGSHSCESDCDTSAGSLVENFQYDCTKQSIRVNHNNDAYLEADDALEFILFEGADPISGQIINRNNDGRFTFNSSTMQFGRPLKIAAIAGTAVNSHVDLYDNCLDVSKFIEVTYHEAPAIVQSVAMDTSLLLTCDISEVLLETIIEKGSGQFNMAWQGNGLQSDTSILVANTPGVFYFKLVDNITNCVLYDSAVVAEDKTFPVINFAPVPNLDCLTPQIVLDASQSERSDSFEYRWFTLDGNILKESPDLKATVDASGSYLFHIKDIRNGCESTQKVEVENLNDGIQSVNLEVDEVLCNGNRDASVEVVEIIGGSGNYEFTFDQAYFGSNNKFEGLSAGGYYLHVEDDRGCSLDTFVSVDEPMPLEIGLEENYFITLGESISLLPEPNFTPQSVQWLTQYGDLLSDSLHLHIKPNRSNVYKVIMADDMGCRIEKQIIIRAGEPTGLVYIPNAFSPNGDHQNDWLHLYPHSSVQRILYFKIYSRWGDLVYGCENDIPVEGESTCSWDGRLKGETMKPSVFVYIAEIELIDGTLKTLTGEISLIR